MPPHTRQSQSSPVLLLLTVILLVLASPARALEPVTLKATMSAQLVREQLQYWVDEAGDTTFETVYTERDYAFRAVERVDHHFPFGEQTYWLRFSVSNPGEQPLRWRMEFHQEQLDGLDVYVIDAKGGLLETIRYQLKDGHNPRLIDFRHFLATFDTAPGETLGFYIRAWRDKPTPLSASDVRLWTAEAFEGHIADQYFWFGLFYGGMVIAMLYNLMLFFSIRENTYLYYVLYLATISASWLCQNGIGGHLFWSGNATMIDLAPVTFALLSVLCGSLYTRAFLGTAERSPTVDRFILGITLLSGLGVLVALAGMLDTAINLAYLVVGVSVFTYPFIGGYIWSTGYKPARIYTVAWLFFGSGTLMLVLQHQGAINSDPIFAWGGQAGNWIEAILLSIALADRFNAVQKEKEYAQALYRETLLEAKLELEERVAERTAELNEAKEAAETLARTDALTGMPNRRCFFEQAERNLSLSRRYHHPLSVLTLDVDHFKRINDRHGHAIGDMALQAIAEALPVALRETDVAGRIGGEEFAVLLPETGEQQAQEIAERLRQSIANIGISTGGEAVPLTASFGLAVLEEEEHFSELLARADQALYQAKEQGRNQVVCAA